jgi:hypothetical protein
MKTSVSVIKVTPEMASEWLTELFPGQRHVRVTHVEKLASDMRAGLFAIGPDAILRIKGRLANGQHRLAAVVEANKSQEFIVMESNDDDLYKVIDAGIKRSVGDALRQANGNLENITLIPAVARWVFRYDNKDITLRGGGKTGASHPAMVGYCEENQQLITQAIQIASPLYKQTKLLATSIGGMLYMIAARAGKSDEGEAFLKNVFLDGGPNAAGDLRNRLIANKTSRARLNNNYLAGISIKALDLYLKGSRKGVLSWREGEELPVIA